MKEISDLGTANFILLWIYKTSSKLVLFVVFSVPGGKMHYCANGSSHVLQWFVVKRLFTNLHIFVQRISKTFRCPWFNVLLNSLQIPVMPVVKEPCNVDKSFAIHESDSSSSDSETYFHAYVPATSLQDFSRRFGARGLTSFRIAFRYKYWKCLWLKCLVACRRKD
jgi:hypothetical protein